MSGPKLRVFLSSKMNELALERQSVKIALAERDVDVFVFELDAGARAQSIQQTYLEEVEHADVYVGLFWKEYGQYTIDEYEHAQTLGMDCLIYEKRDGVGTSRDPQLENFLDRVGDVKKGATIKWFTTSDELARLVAEDVAAWQAQKIREGRTETKALYSGVPEMPIHFVGREDIVQQVVRALRSDTSRALAMEGLPGVGKTSIAIAIAHHAGIRRRFTGGVLWASLGQRAWPTTILNSWAGALGCDTSQYPAVAGKAQALRDVLGQRHFLLVLDDAWDYPVADLLRCGGPNCRYLLTTRDKEIAHKFAGQDNAFIIDPLTDDLARSLLKLLAPEILAANAESVSRLLPALGGLPIALSLVGGYLATPEHAMFAEIFPDLSRRSIDELMQPERRLKLARDSIQNIEHTSATLEDIIDLSLYGLQPHIVHAFQELGAFAPEPATFTIEAAKTVTGADDIALAKLAARNLLKLDKSRNASLHAIISDYAFSRVSSEAIVSHAQYYLSQMQAKNGIDAVFLDVHLFQQVHRAWTNCSVQADLLSFFDLLQPYLKNHGMSEINLDWGERLLNMLDDETDASAKAAVMVTMSGEFGELHQWDEAIRLCTNALERLAKVGDVVGIGRVYAHLSTYHLYNDDLKSAQDYRDRAVDIMTSNDDYYGAKDFLLTMFLAQSRVGGTDYWDNYEDVKQQEMVALGKEQGPMELSPIRMRLVSPRRAELGRCLPLLLLRRWLIDKKTPRRIRIFLGVLKNEGGKDSYHYLCILGDPGGQIQFESLTVEKSLRDSLPDGDHFLHVLFNEESLMRILVEPNPTNSHILEWEGDLYQLATVAKLLKEG